VEENTIVQEGDIIPTKGTLLSFKTDGVGDIDVVAKNLNFTTAFAYSLDKTIMIIIYNILMASAKNNREGQHDGFLTAIYTISDNSEESLIETFKNIAVDFATAKDYIGNKKDDLIKTIRDIAVKFDTKYTDDNEWQNSEIYKYLHKNALSVIS
jgi:hypothetical protein